MVANRLAVFYSITGAKEYHASMELVVDKFVSAKEQLQLLENAVKELSESLQEDGLSLVWKRFFVSDAINQSRFLNKTDAEAMSIVQQPPLSGFKATVLVYFVEDAQMATLTDNTVVMKRPGYEHFFHAQMHERAGDVSHQTQQIFNRYCDSLSQNGCSLEKNCIRTWIYVQNVDVQYAGMVVARRELFEREGLTPKTHFIASTGIEGRHIHPESLVVMDAYAVSNLKPGQVRFLKAPAHLNPTHEYGVTFERGTVVEYGDRRHVFISGTASINNKGEVVHPLDIEKQTVHTFNNVKALLAEADAGMDDVVHMIVYLRDIADYHTVNRYIEQHYITIPHVVVLAPVCRPGWLVEVECMAIVHAENKQYMNF